MTNTNLPAQEPKKLTPASILRAKLSDQAISKRFEQMLGERAPHFISSLISAVSAPRSPLAECEPNSIIAAAANAAAMDLPINQSLGFAWIVPYREKGRPLAQFQIGWKGIVQLALRSGLYKTINATNIYEGQLVDFNPFTGDMKFQPEAKSNTVIGYLLYFRLLNGFEKYVYLSRENAEAHGRKYSKSYNFGWANNFDAMALKTVVKNGLSKWGPLSVGVSQALIADQSVKRDIDAEEEYLDNPGNDEDGGMDVLPAEGTDDKPKRTSRLAKIVEEKAAAPTQVAESVTTTEEPPPLPDDEKLPFEP